jgi:hypothetical protein
MALRLMWLGVACLIAWFAAAVFDRFDATNRVRAEKGSRRAARRDAAEPAARTGTGGGAPLHLTPLVVPDRAHTLVRLFAAELRLALFGLRWWWYWVAIGLLIAQFVAPLAAARGPLVASAWMWCVFVWSGMGAREARYGTEALLFACARLLPRQMLACWAAGVAVSFLIGAGAAVRLAIAGEASGLLAWLAGALLLPSAALLLGVVSGSGKPFEAALTLAWYVGPMSHTPGLDFTGTANGAHTIAYAVVALGSAAGAVVAACGVRWRQLRRGLL